MGFSTIAAGSANLGLELRQLLGARRVLKDTDSNIIPQICGSSGCYVESEIETRRMVEHTRTPVNLQPGYLEGRGW